MNELDLGKIPIPTFLSCENIPNKYTSALNIPSFKTQFTDLLIKVLPRIR